MARVSIGGRGFRNLKVGERQLLTIVSASKDDKTGVIKVRFEDEEGRSGTETYRIGKGRAKSRANEIALDSFATMAFTALRNWEVDEIDVGDLVGRRVIANVVAQEAENGNTYTHLRNWDEVEEDEPFDSDEATAPEAEEDDAEVDEDDLDDEDLWD